MLNWRSFISKKSVNSIKYDIFLRRRSLAIAATTSRAQNNYEKRWKINCRNNGILQRTGQRSVFLSALFSTISRPRKSSILTRQQSRFGPQFGAKKRHFAGPVLLALARGATKVRYWILGGTIVGGAALGQRYEEWKENLPDVKWLKDQKTLNLLKERFRNARGEFFENGTEWSSWAREKAADAGSWLSKIQEKAPENGNEKAVRPITSSDVIFALSGDAAPSADSSAKISESDRMQNFQEDSLKAQAKLQGEVNRIEKENKELKKQLLLLREKSVSGRRRKAKRSLIDMYSDVLDHLMDYDSSYNTQDNLPRVVVVGDQSSGKTSVLEMIASARIFPRGSGEMMTRAPVKVTLSEGPYHIAQFKDSIREFDLAKESDLEALRKEIELRMRNSVAKGKTVSSETIALTVKGPNLPRMVLVDLPGVISTVTTDMASETKDEIVKMCKASMENPNAIILCIQDGSVDAERSNVTDLVNSMDPKGLRTILVLTKVDLAEANLTNPDRIKKILEGQLFPMKALGYFAVVTGKGNTKDSIETIREYEEGFFRSSKLFKDGILKPSQMTTRSMSIAVSDVFWRMVRDSIEQQADAFRATRFNLETEWKNTFPRQRELDRDELFEKARGEILDEIVNLSHFASKDWEEALEKRLWDKLSSHVFESIYLPAALSDTVGKFNTIVDQKLSAWTDLAKKSIQVGWDTLRELFYSHVEEDAKKRADHDTLFEPLKLSVIETAMADHQWDEKALDYLKVIQKNALDDKNVVDKQAWDGALDFFNNSVKRRLEYTTGILKEMNGPGFFDRWFMWRSQTEENALKHAIQHELLQLLAVEPDHGPTLKEADFLVVKKNLEGKDFRNVSDETIRNVFHHVFRRNFLEKSANASRECRNFFYQYEKGYDNEEVNCHHVILFWRLQKMLTLTANALRQQITNTEQRRLEREMKDVLEDWSQDEEVKNRLLVGRRVELAEELKKVREIQERLEEFVTALSQEKT